MTCRCCISLRSSVYFFASIHIFFALLLFGRFALHTAVYIYRYYTLADDQQTSLTFILFSAMLVDAFFLPLGCMIFRGVERESLRLIKIPGTLYAILKLVEFGFKFYHTYRIYVTPEKQVDLDTFIYQGIDLFGTLIYLIVLYCYYRKLKKIARDYESDCGEQYDYYDPPTEHSMTINSSKLLPPVE